MLFRAWPVGTVSPIFQTDALLILSEVIRKQHVKQILLSVYCELVDFSNQKELPYLAAIKART